MQLLQSVTSRFEEIYGTEPEIVVRAPGRVNLIGEHTDYNDGYVLPIAIDRSVIIALQRRNDRKIVLHSLDFDAPAQFSLDNITHERGWSDYVRGVAAMLQQHDYRLKGWQGVVGGDVPIGSGLSSSAALELAVARAFQAVSAFEWDKRAMAKVGRAAETDWMGVSIGIMDQLISAAAERNHATLIDCRTLDLTHVPLPDGIAVVVLDTGTRRELVDSAYNERRNQCQQAAQHFGVDYLRDVTLDQFIGEAHALDQLTRRRARHVITENDRVLAAVRALRNHDVITLGALLNASHDSLKYDFEVSSPALDAIVAIAQRHYACYGARMTGAGFGGCAVALVHAGAAGDFTERVAPAYQDETGNTPAVYVCSAAGGAEILHAPA